jgi:hypothetical protein
MEWLGTAAMVPLHWLGGKVTRLAEWILDAVWDRWLAQRRSDASAAAPAAAAGVVHNVASHHQSGGITAHTVNQAPEPELRCGPLASRRNPNGTHTITCTLDVIAPYPPAELSLQVEAVGLVSLDVKPHRVGPNMIGHSGMRDGWGFTSVINPSGRYTLSVVASEPRFGIAYKFL